MRKTLQKKKWREELGNGRGCRRNVDKA
jgi:hypothetical protein